MVPRNPLLRTILGNIFYTPESACNAALLALFDTSLGGGELVSNNWNFFLHTKFGRMIIEILSILGLRHMFLQVFVSSCMGILQHFFFGYYVQQCNMIFSDDFASSMLSDELYQWTLEEVQQYIDSANSGMDENAH